MHQTVRIARQRLLYVSTRGQNLDRKRDTRAATRQERIFADTVSGTALGWTGSPEAFRQSLVFQSVTLLFKAFVPVKAEWAG